MSDQDIDQELEVRRDLPGAKASEFPQEIAGAPGSLASASLTPEPPSPEQKSDAYRGLKWIFVGSDGLRAGWSVLLFVLMFLGIAQGLAYAFSKAHLLSRADQFSPRAAFFGELVAFLAMMAAAAIMALIERRGSLMAYNLRGQRRISHFFAGFAIGFLALSALIGALAAGGWLQFGPVALSGAAILKYCALWGAAFFLVGCVEEGLFRGYLQFTLTRGINFWIALGLVGLMCGDLLVRTMMGISHGNGVWGVYVIGLMGLVPCLLLHVNKVPGSNFWQAAWVTSTLFGLIHTGNNGENWIGIFAAAAIGFVFCVSIWVTGSAWWAIGCHMAWDWAETFFYGAADSGNVATGHYLSTSPAGNALWSGGTDGPEGSLLVIGIIVLLLIVLLAIYRRRSLAIEPVMGRLEQTAG